jgi:hypothetical protein
MARSTAAPAKPSCIATPNIWLCGLTVATPAAPVCPIAERRNRSAMEPVPWPTRGASRTNVRDFLRNSICSPTEFHGCDYDRSGPSLGCPSAGHLPGRCNDGQLHYWRTHLRLASRSLRNGTPRTCFRMNCHRPNRLTDTGISSGTYQPFSPVRRTHL